MIKRAILCGVVALAAASTYSATAAADVPSNELSPVLDETRQYIVVLRAGPTTSAQVAEQHGKVYGFMPQFVYGHALRGYGATLPDAALAGLQSRPEVLMIAPDVAVSAFASKPPPPPSAQPAQAVPTGVARVGAVRSKTADIDGHDDRRVDVDIAVLDTGITTLHPDLNVSGGVACSSGKSWEDDNGHGTHVAGTAAAIDNEIGVVGVAPGSRVWSVKMLGSNGGGSIGGALCGIDWVTANADVIEVANLSWGAKGEDDGNCGLSNKDALHFAICNSVAAGVTYVAAAGNDGSAIGQVPAAYDEVMTVSAFTDYDGRPGGLSAVPAGCINSGADDTFAIFSNFGADVDIAAPGACINSTWPFRIYRVASGTSMSTPHVAGAAALYLEQNPGASPAQVSAALLAAADPGPTVGDPDAFPEPVLNVSGF